jgi:hypothetical protein
MLDFTSTPLAEKRCLMAVTKQVPERESLIQKAVDEITQLNPHSEQEETTDSPAPDAINDDRGE